MTEAGEAFSKKKMIGFLLGIAVIAPVIYLVMSIWKSRRHQVSTEIPQFQSEEQGLTESEVFARRTDVRVLARQKKEKTARKKRLQKRIFSIFNLTILVFAVSLLLLRDFWGAVGTLAALVFNIGVNTFQETRAARQMQELAGKARPYATVIRAGRLRNLNLDDVVIDDVLVAGQGDEILADGTLLEGEELRIDETILGPLGGVVSKQPGDLLQAGSFCISGWAVYRAQSIPIDENINHQNNLSDGSTKSLTPLQSIVTRTLYALLFITGLFYISIVLEILHLDAVLRQENLSTYRNVLSIIFNIAPGGLFFMIVINYAVGSGDIARIGALVRSSLLIESMAQMTTICLIRRGSLSGMALELAMIPAPSGAPVLTENRARRILGDFAHTASSNRFPITTLKESLEGQRQPDVGQAPYLSINGWQAINFKTRMKTGSYVLGYPDILQPYFSNEVDVKGEQEKTGNGSRSKAGIGNFVRRIIHRNNSDATIQDEKVALEAPAEMEQDLRHTLEEEEESKGLRKWTKTFLSRMTRGREQSKVQSKDSEEQTKPKVILRLIFAYSPDTQPLFDHSGRPQCPKNLIPICSVRFVEQIRPEVQEAVKTFQEAGVDIKVLSEDDPNRILAIAAQVGLVKPDAVDVSFLTSDNLLSMDSQALGNSILEKAIFARLNSEQMARIVELLQLQGEYVGVVGNASADFHIMRQSQIAITHTGSDPRLLSDSDIILTKNSLEALPGVLKKGQQIVNGTLDVLKLNLNQILYILFLLASMFIAGERTFYYTPAQGSAIGIFTVVIPSIGLSFWATAKAVNRSNMHQQLVHFVTPAAIMTTLFVRLVDSLFFSKTLNIEYTHLAVTHLLVGMGLLLVIFVKPPLNPLKIAGKGSRDWRITFLVGALFILFHIATVVPLAQKYLMIGPLASAQDYLFIWGVSLVWAAMTFIIWRLRWLQRFLGWSARWLAPNPQSAIDSDKATV